MEKAKTVYDVISSLQPRPLNENEINVFHVETYDGRGSENVRGRIKRYLETSDVDNNFFKHILLVGHKGTGKSTELVKLTEEIKDKYLVVKSSVYEVDYTKLDYLEVILLAIEKLTKEAEKLGIDINENEPIYRWIRSEDITEIREKYLTLGGEAELGTEVAKPLSFLVKFFGKLRFNAALNRTFKEEVKSKIEPKLSEILDFLNYRLITKILERIRKTGKTSILLIFEDFDKLDPKIAEDLFFNHTQHLISIKCNILYTFPISAYYNIGFGRIRGNFEVFELPMIKIKNKKTDKNNNIIFEPFETGREVLKQILEKRIEIKEIFERSELVDKLIDMSGGCIVDLFRLIIEAANYAMDDNNVKINEKDCDLAIQKLKREYKATIAENPEKQKTSKDYYDRLVNIAQNPIRIDDNDDIVLDLRHNLCVLSYNGVGWCDVHPIVREILKDFKLI